MAPLIGISTSEMRGAENSAPLRESEPQTRELALGLAYPAAVAACGGVPVIVPPVGGADLDELLGRLGGLLLSGGPDLHPSAYGEQAHPALGPTEPELDTLELAMVRAADARRMPVLALCRGAQVLNVARGGTLIQDLPDLVSGSVQHRQTQPGTETTHPVRIAKGSLLARAMGSCEVAVNSFHHQAVRELGRNLKAVAWCADDVIEGIEATDREFAVGVQWHAESLVAASEHRALFVRFIAAAAAYEQSGRRPAAAA